MMEPATSDKMLNHQLKQEIVSLKKCGAEAVVMLDDILEDGRDSYNQPTEAIRAVIRKLEWGK